MTSNPTPDLDFDTTPETARALLWRHGLPEDVIDGALALHAQELASVQRAALAKTDDPVFYEGEAGWLVDLITPGAEDEARLHDPAVPCVSAVDQTTRDRIAAMLRPHANLGGTPPRYEVPLFDGATPSLPRISGWRPLDEVVDALAVLLLPPADRAAVLTEAADELGRMDYDTDSNDYGYDTYRDAWNGGVMDGADLLRRLADEAQPPAVGARQPDTETQAVEAHPPTHTWKVESPRRDTWASWGATHDERVWAAASYEDVIEVAPQRPFRLVRATTTYAVEAEYTPAASAVPGRSTATSLSDCECGGSTPHPDCPIHNPSTEAGR